MSKPWKHAQPDTWRGPSAGQQSYGQQRWRLWKGAHSPAEPWRRSETPTFPAYTQLTLQEAAPPHAGDTEVDVGSDGVLQMMQRALTHAKKAEHRVRTLTQQKERTLKLWESYKAKMEEAYLKEHKRHLQDLARIQKDMAVALTQQEEAREAVRGTYRGEKPPPSADEEHTKALAAEWAAMRGRWEHAAVNEMDGVLRRAMHGDVAMDVADPMPEPAPGHGTQKQLRPEVLRQLFSETEVQAILQAGIRSAAGPAATPAGFGDHMGPPGLPVPGTSAEPPSGAFQGHPPSTTLPCHKPVDPYPPSPSTVSGPSFEMHSPATLPDSALRTVMHQHLGAGDGQPDPTLLPGYTKKTSISPNARVNPYLSARLDGPPGDANQAARSTALEQRIAATRASLLPFRCAGPQPPKDAVQVPETGPCSAAAQRRCVIEDDDEDGLEEPTDPGGGEGTRA